jgi:hypothetical protein
MERIKVPSSCPKCGDDYGFLYSRPKYIPTYDDEYYVLEYLEFSCHICGFTIKRPTADSKEILNA